MQVANGVLIGASHFPKSRNLKAIPKAAVSVKALERTIKENSLLGLSPESVVTLIDYQDNTLVKEQIYLAASKVADVFFFYYSGNIVLRKDQLYLSTPESSHEMIYANGIAFHELLAIFEESPAQNKIVFLDAQFINGDQELSSQDKIGSEELLTQFVNAIPGCVLISSAPGVPFHLFNGGYETTLLTTAFIHCLKQGSKSEKPELVLGDLVVELISLMTSNGEYIPFVAGKYKESDLYILPNFRYLEFKTYLKDADQLFSADRFSEAYIAYNHCQMLFPSNDAVGRKVAFIRHFVEGESKLEKQDFAAAYEAFSAANEIIANKKVHQNQILSLEKWALLSFETGKFEIAKAKYELLLKLTSDLAKYEPKIKEVEAELAFAAAVDLADKHYYENHYQKAATEYEKALKIKYDVRVSRRKSECDALIEKEGFIKQKIEADIREELVKKFETEFETQFSSKKQDIIENEITSIKSQHQNQIDALKHDYENQIKLLKIEFESQKNQALSSIEEQWQNKMELLAQQSQASLVDYQNQFEQKLDELEQKFWSALSLWNHLDGYLFYIDFFKQGKHIAKAQKRVGELQTLQATSSEPSQTAPVFELEVEMVHTQQSHEQITETEIHHDDQEFLLQTDSDFDQAQPISEPQINPINQEPEIEHIQEDKSSRKELKFEVIERPKRRIVEPTPEPEPVNMSEQELWNYATSGANVESFMFYIENSKEKKYIADAYYQINRIKKGEVPTIEPQSESQASDYDSIAKPSYFSAQAQPTQVPTDQLNQEEESLWSKASAEDTISAYYSYINNSKIKTYWEQAKERIALLKLNSKATEQADWETAERAGTIEAYQEYIRKYPLGNFYAQAMFKINKLQS